jgi:uncharacterized protein (TIGR02453 family)
MKNATIQTSTFAFLNDLKKNNNREWFAEHKPRYEQAHQNMIQFADSLLEKLIVHDNISTASGKASLFRIYADTRFSKDKTPYKTHWGLRFARATDFLRGGIYVHIEPGNSFVGGGFFNPNADDLFRIRQDIELNYEDWNALFADARIKNTFGNLRGEQLKTAPKGFPKDHPGIEFLRHKQFLLSKTFTDQEVLSTDFASQLDETIQHLRPFFDYMSEVLTTNTNGEPLF